MKFAVGDKVRLQIDDEDPFLSDLESDLQMDLLERDISGSQYDKFYEIMETVVEGQSPVFTVVGMSNGAYELKCDKLRMRYMFPGKYLVSA